MAELYHHRAVLFSVIVRMFPHRSWKSKLHHDGTMYDGMFIVGIDTDQGQATYHYDVDPYWDLFDCKELGRAPEWDGHTSDEAIKRIATLNVFSWVGSAWDKWHKSLRHDEVKTVGDAVEQLMYESIEFGGDMGPNGNTCSGIDEGDVLTAGFINGWIERFESVLGHDRYTYEQWRAISEAIGDAMEYAHDKAIECPDRADPLWNLDEYVNRVLEVAFSGRPQSECGECYVECFDGGVDETLDGEWISYAPPTWYLSCGHIVEGCSSPNFCPVCGRHVKDDA